METVVVDETLTNALGSPVPVIPAQEQAVADDDATGVVSEMMMGPPPPPAPRAAAKARRPRKNPGGTTSCGETVELFKCPAVKRSAMLEIVDTVDTTRTAIMGPPPIPPIKKRRLNPLKKSVETVNYQQISERNLHLICHYRMKRLIRIQYLEDLIKENEEEIALMQEELVKIKKMVGLKYWPRTQNVD